MDGCIDDKDAENGDLCDTYEELRSGNSAEGTTKHKRYRRGEREIGEDFRHDTRVLYEERLKEI